MAEKRFGSWERDVKKRMRRWLMRPLVTLPWEVKPGHYFPSPPPTRTGPEIAALRQAEGLSQRELAHFLNVSPKTVQSWEQGARTPEGPVDRLLQVLDEIGRVGFFQLCGGTSVEPDEEP